jgi:hypothetical protein
MIKNKNINSLFLSFHPFYYQPTATNTVPQAIQLAPPNLLVPNASLMNNSTLGNGPNSATPTLIDISSAYGAQMTNANALNSNRTSPFDPTNPFLQLNAANAAASNPAVLNSILAANAANQQSVAAAAAAAVVSNVPVQNANYFTLPQHLASTFQSQLQDRLNI